MSSPYRNNATNSRSTQTKEAKNYALQNEYSGQTSLTRANIDPRKLDWIDWQTRMVQRLERKYGSGADYNNYVGNRGCRYNPITCLNQPIDAAFCTNMGRTSRQPYIPNCPPHPPIHPMSICQAPPSCYNPECLPNAMYPPPPGHYMQQPMCVMPAPRPDFSRPPPPRRTLSRRPPFETRTVSRLSYVPMPYTRVPALRPQEMLRIPGAMPSTNESVYTRSYMPVVDLSSCRRVPVRHTDNLPLTPLPETPVRPTRNPLPPCGPAGWHPC